MATDTDIREALRQVVDPELGVNIVDLGLVYAIELTGDRVRIEMTMTTPACPLKDYLKDQVADAIATGAPEVSDVDIVIVSEPPWSADLMSDDARRQLGGRW